ncbi:MAG: putative amidohydrolase YtcJ [Halieaceae bacterium]|jgi:predicted amidohydrolase YtcJ
MQKLVFTLLCMIFTPAQASTLIHNVNGYTLNNGEVIQFSALEFADGKVVKTFQENDPDIQADSRIDGAGATMLPGLIDSHGHLASYGRALDSVDLVGVASEASAVARVASFMAKRTSRGDWILGRGWNQVLWDTPKFPQGSSLDVLGDEAAIALHRIDGHALWVNSKALMLAGIEGSTEDPPGGEIIRDTNGRATGVLIDNAMNLVLAVLPTISDDQLQDHLLSALRKLASFGLTSLHDAGVKAQQIRVMQTLARSNKLPVRVYAMLKVLDDANDVYLEGGIQLDDAQMLDIRSVKISADGALGSRGAALATDYSDQPGHRGLFLLNDLELERQMTRAMAKGFQVNVHAIGDSANTRVLDLFEQLLSGQSGSSLRHRVEHAQILDPSDINRFASIGVIASIQPTHATSDKNMARTRLGQKRLEGAYAWRSLLESNANLAGGSDFPIESANPFYGLHAAVTRQDHQNQPPEGWFPTQKLSRAQALAMFTEGAAYAAHQEKTLGRLLPGYWADFVLLRDDYFTVPEQNIWQNQVLKTFVAGELIYSCKSDDC